MNFEIASKTKERPHYYEPADQRGLRNAVDAVECSSPWTELSDLNIESMNSDVEIRIRLTEHLHASVVVVALLRAGVGCPVGSAMFAKNEGVGSSSLCLILVAQSTVVAEQWVEAAVVVEQEHLWYSKMDFFFLV